MSKGLNFQNAAIKKLRCLKTNKYYGTVLYFLLELGFLDELLNL